MAVDLVSELAAVDAEEFDALDATAGAVASYHRLAQHERDARWRVRYARVTDGPRLLAMLPTYACRGDRWADPSYDPARWPESTAADTGPGGYLLVGGSADLRSGFHVGPELRSRIGPLLTAVAGAAAAEGRGLLFPYAYGPTREVLDAATGGRISWAPVGAEAVFAQALGGEAELSSRVRRVLRRDRNLIAEQEVEAAAWPWGEVAGEAAEVIAVHNTRKGLPDHPEFVRMRYAQWADCPSVELVVFTARTEGVRAVATGLVWRDELAVHEIALTGEDGPVRLAAYVSVLYHQPARYGAERGLRLLRGGLAATAPKAMRGAEFRELHGGVLDAAATRELLTRP
ncbi:hypothetical protein CFP65_5864 [Kitasatospora sp. MMS16-BH015]|uniref:hypothetical protein n=1 Tax=Kitasatospora sp. MMS16-BH015 TaxID=2018025 RepID=UPI000CA0F1F6|nr:hypothetical protein [Kitasatospora sp. MMS16-BH015]AUG80545.1 hypothetical protein CFP65_5864 [Kitasatospora sp. MMS16-BH015]